MIQNKLILYCGRLEQAMLWEVCKKRRCATSNCLFKKITKSFGENLWSKDPTRIATVTAAKDQLEAITQPIVLVRTPVVAKSSPSSRTITVLEQTVDDPPLQRTHERTPVTSLSDMLREEIIKAAGQLK